MSFPKDFFDIEISLEELMEHSSIDDYLSLKEMKQRKLFLTDGVDMMSIDYIIKAIWQYNNDDAGTPTAERKPILLYVASPGGQIDAGFALIDAILTSQTPVYTINIGFAYSMGFLIMLAGHKRFSMPNAKYLLHDGSNGVWDSGAKAQDRMEFDKRVEQRMATYIINHTKITEEEYREKFRVEWYMFADEAKEKGVIDYIIGEDVTIDEVV